MNHFDTDVCTNEILLTETKYYIWSLLTVFVTLNQVIQAFFCPFFFYILLYVHLHFHPVTLKREQNTAFYIPHTHSPNPLHMWFQVTLTGLPLDQSVTICHWPLACVSSPECVWVCFCTKPFNVTASSERPDCYLSVCETARKKWKRQKSGKREKVE